MFLQGLIVDIINEFAYNKHQKKFLTAHYYKIKLNDALFFSSNNNLEIKRDKKLVPTPNYP